MCQQMKALGWAMCLALLVPYAMANPHVQVVGLFPNAAIVNIDGKRTLLKVGQVGPHNIQVLSADSKKAVLTVGGVAREFNVTRDASMSEVSNQPKRFTVPRGKGGHYWINGSINQSSMLFLVDTGASAVALNEIQAKRLGIDFKTIGQPIQVHTASGDAQGWRVKLNRVKVGELEVLGVDAVVLEGSSPREVLLGMSFLNQLNWRQEQGALVLEAKY